MMIRPFQNPDQAQVEELVRECSAASGRSLLGGFDSLAAWFSRPGFSAGRGLWVAEHVPAGLVGFICLIPEKKIRRAVCEIYVLESYRNRGIGSSLLDTASAKDSGTESIDKHHVPVYPKQKDLRHLLEKKKFKPVRRHRILTVPLNEEWDLKSKKRVGIVPFKEGEESLLADIQNRSFRGSWGFSPNDSQDIRYYFRFTACRRKDVLFLREAGQTVGYFWGHPVVRNGRFTEEGRVHMIGIDPSYRGKGRGRYLLSQGLGNMYAQGCRRVELTVDAENRTAISLYKSMGFRFDYEVIWYEKDLTS